MGLAINLSQSDKKPQKEFRAQLKLLLLLRNY